MRGEAVQPFHVQYVGDLVHQFGQMVDDGNVGVLAGEIARDVEADLTGAADDHLHGLSGAGG